MNKLGTYLVNQNIIDKEDQEIWDYGVFVILFNGITIITTLLLGTLMLNWRFALYFLLYYFPIRLLLGGGHCQTPQKCFIFTHIDLVIVFVIAIVFPPYLLNIFSLISISTATIFYLLSNKEKIFKIIFLIFMISDMLVFSYMIYLRLSMSCAFLLSSYLYFSDKLQWKKKETLS